MAEAHNIFFCVFIANILKNADNGPIGGLFKEYNVIFTGVKVANS